MTSSYFLRRLSLSLLDFDFEAPDEAEMLPG